MFNSTVKEIGKLFSLPKRYARSLLTGTLFIDNTQIILQTIEAGTVKVVLREFHWNGTSVDEVFPIVEKFYLDSEKVKECRCKIKTLLDDSYKITRTYDKPETRKKKYGIVKAIF